MNYNKKTVKDIDVAGKKVLLRCDFNVPQDKATGVITDDKRIVAALPTIQYLLEQNAAVIACSHLGKPKEGPDPKFSLAPVAKRLSELLGREVIMAADVVGPDATAKAAALKPGQILLLENTRFEKGETKNDPELARKMAAMADVYVSDAFGAVHRAHASTAGVAAYLPAVSGFLIQKELEIAAAPGQPCALPCRAIPRPKVSSKIGVINHLLDIADTIIIGGGMCYTFTSAPGHLARGQPPEADWLDYCREMMQKAKDGRRRCLARGRRGRRGVLRRCHAGGRGRRGYPRRHDGYGHRSQDHRPACRGRERGRHRYLERPHGRV